MARKREDAGKAPKRTRARAVPKVVEHESPLNYRQRLFVAYYLGESGGNATEAARKAGYAKPNVQCARLLANVSIQRAIAARLDDVTLTADEILSRLADMATVDVADFLAVKSDGSWALDLPKAIKAGKTHLIKSIKEGQWGTEIRFHDAQAALVKLGTYRQLFKASDDDGNALGLAILDRLKLLLQPGGAAPAGEPDGDRHPGQAGLPKPPGAD